MRRLALVGLLVGVLVVGTVLTGCGGGQGADGPITVLAASSLTDALSGFKPRPVTYSFAGSQQLVAQVKAGAPADVVITADELTMGALDLSHKVVRPTVPVAGNRLAIAVRPGNPKGIRTLADLAKSGTVVVLADPAVPAGRLAKAALERGGVDVYPASLELDVRAAVQKVAMDEADAALVYETDLRAFVGKVDRVALPAVPGLVNRYVAAVVKASTHREAAEAYVAALRGDAGQTALRAAGFEVLPG